jgi:hypothetical protein
MKKTVFYRKCILALLILACSGSVGAQLLSERPQALGGVLLGSWEADKDPLQVYAPAEVALAVSAQFTGETSGTLTFDALGNFEANYITVSVANLVVLFTPLEISVADTNQFAGTYTVSETQLMLTPNNTAIAPDTLAFTATTDSLHFIQPVPLGEFASLAAALVPPDDPITAVLSFAKVNSSAGTEPVTADFDNSGVVDFADFIAFVSHFGARSGDAAYDVAFDLDSSGAVDFTDFLSFAAQFGSSSGS